MSKEIAKTKKFCTALRKLNALVIPMVAGPRRVAGIPDRYVCHKYWQGFLEFKDANTTLTSLQFETIMQMNDRAYGTAFVIRFQESINLEFNVFDCMRHTSLFDGDDVHHLLLLLQALKSRHDLFSNEE